MIFVPLLLTWKVQQTLLASDVGEQSTNQIRQEETCRPIGNNVVLHGDSERAMLRAKQQLLRLRVKTRDIFINEAITSMMFRFVGTEREEREKKKQFVSGQ